MPSVNKVILIGNLGKDPEVRSFQDGGKVVNMTIATSESWNDRATGERKEKTEWHNVVVKNESLATYAEAALQKGSTVYIEGQIQTRKFVKKDGQDGYITEIVLGPFKSTLQGLRNLRERADGGEPRGRAPQKKVYDDLDDSIPF